MDCSSRIIRRITRFCLFVGIAVSVLTFMACTSPAEQAQNYYKSGVELFEQGDSTKARLEFQNALQLAAGMTEATYGLALIAEKEADWEQVYRLLSRVVEQDPKHHEAHLKLGRILLAAGQLDAALGFSNTALELDPANPGVLSLRAAVLLKLEDIAGAIKYANAALEHDAENVEALVILASERLRAGEAREAIAYLDRGIVRDKNNITLQLIKIQAMEAGGDLDGAEAIFQQLIEAHPSMSALRQTLAQFYIRQGEQAKTEALLRSIAHDYPEQFQAKLDLIRFINTVHGAEASIRETKALIKQDPGNTDLRFVLADLYRHHNDQDAMVEVLQLVIADSGDNADGLKARGLLANLLLSQGNREQAKKLIREILSVDQRHENGVILKVMMALDERKLDEAVADLRMLLQDVPDSARGLRLLGHAHDLAGSPELAEGQYLRAFQASGMEVAYGLTYAEYLLKLGNGARAERVMESVLRKSPNNLDALKMLAQIRISLGNWAGAQQVADTIGRLDGQEPISDQIRGVALAGKNEYNASIAAFQNAFNAAEDPVQPMIALVRTYVAAGRLDDAVAFVDSVLKASPGNSNAVLLKGQLQQLQGDEAGAAESYRLVIRERPDSPLGYRNLASLNYRQQLYAEAEEVIRQGLAAVPGDIGLQLAKASLFEASDRIEDAIDVYERLIEERPNADIVANNLAALLSEHRSDEKSFARAYELARRFERSDIPQFTNTLGWVNHRFGRYSEAEHYLRDAVNKMPNMAIFRYHLGMNYLALQNKEAARRELQKAVELASVSPFSQFEHAQEKLLSL